MHAVSVIIPLYNGKETIRGCLESLLRQTFIPAEVIVVDNGSNDGSRRVVGDFAVQHPELHVILETEEIRGPSACRNRGVSASRGDILCFTDADCVADKDWIKDLLQVFDQSEVGAVAGNIYGYEPSNLIQKFLSVYTLRGLQEEMIFERYTLTGGGFATANLSVRREVFYAIGGFDETMRYGEDHDLCSRIMQNGYKIKYIPKAVVRHIHRRSFRGLIGQSYSAGIGHAHLLRKYGDGVFILQSSGKICRKEPFPLRVWISIISAEKKLIALVLIGSCLPWGWLLPGFYMLHLARSTFRKARLSGVTLGYASSVVLAGLLIVKSFFLTLGRWAGSLEFRVLCL